MKECRSLTVLQKISLLTGATAWTTTQIESANIPSVKMTDGANGVRNEDICATCFPSPVAVASSFDPDAVRQLGVAVAKECKHFGTNLLLAPAINIKRSPLCGRNAGYYSEDPVVAGETAAAFVSGLQSEGVGACLKHFAVYNQETQRMTCDCKIDEQTLHEIYLRAFGIVIKKSKPAAVMTSYNAVNGVSASENEYLLTDILRAGFGFDGITVSDWGGVNDRVKALKAGLDLEMPSSPYGTRKLTQAYEKGLLTENEIDASAHRLISFARKYAREKDGDCDFEYSKKVALDMATKSVVLLKNDNSLLPIDKRYKNIAVIGEAAKKPRIQSGGCDHTNLRWDTDLLSELKNELPWAKITYAQGYTLSGHECDEELQAQATEAAKASDIVIFVSALPEQYESEGYDRQHMQMPRNQTQLLKKVCEANCNTAAVLQNGAPVDMREFLHAMAILETYLLGGIAGKAVAQILSGTCNPSGKLAETFPLRLEDTPAYLSFAGGNDIAEYGEGLFVGYRYYASKHVPVAFAFGHGLSYTEFNLHNIRISGNELTVDDELSISFDIVNTGNYDGAEVVQLYVHNKNFGRSRPVKELKKFVKCYVRKGSTESYTLTLTNEDVQHYCVNAHDFTVCNGEFDVLIGTSSEDIAATFTVRTSGNEQKITYDNRTRIGQIMQTEKGRRIVEEKLLGYIYMAMFGNFNTSITLGDPITSEPFFINVMNNMPLQALCNFSGGEFDDEKLREVLDLLEKA